jgi:crossover junction endonuclease MUS81
MFKLIIDNREIKLIGLFEATSSPIFNYSVSQLDIGDILISSIKPNEDNKIIYIFERKTIEDLIASIKDGRYKEQKVRLNSIVERGDARKFFYIIEGSTDNLCKTEQSIYQGSLISMIIRDGISVIRTKNINETYDIITRLLQRMEKAYNENKDEFNIFSSSNNPDEAAVLNSNPVSDTSYLEHIKVKKNANITPKICNILALSNIPGVSNKTAEIILSHYNNSIFTLLKGYEAIDMLEEPEELKLKKKENMICNISLGMRKVGNVISKRVYEYLYCST